MDDNADPYSATEHDRFQFSPKALEFISYLLKVAKSLPSTTIPWNSLGEALPSEILSNSLKDILNFYITHGDALFSSASSPLTFELGNLSLIIQHKDNSRLAFSIPIISPSPNRKEVSLKEFIDDVDHSHLPLPNIETYLEIEYPCLSEVVDVPCFLEEDVVLLNESEVSSCIPSSATNTSHPLKEIKALFQHPHIQMPLSILKTAAIYVMAYPNLPNLQSILNFHNELLSEFQLQFISFQLKKLQAYFDHYKLSCTCYNFQQIYLDRGYWVQLRLPTSSSRSENSFQLRIESNESPSNRPACGDSTLRNPISLKTSFSDDPFMNWITGELSNFDYLMYLNNLAGRTWNDCHSHPILPWTTDFLSPSYLDHFKDFSKTQYRRKKGDVQLEMTFQSDLPHHLTSFLTDLTYFIYKARISPKSVLARHVRSKYSPSEFPKSMSQMFSWTSDECIPEFYSSPSIFISCHPDMPNLSLPSWANTPAEFVVKHRQILESPTVSEHLHEWIDLIFGYRLLGPKAIESKNVVLALAHPEQASILTPYHNVRQLFKESHPKRFSMTTLKSLQAISLFRQHFPKPFLLPNPTHPSLPYLYHLLTSSKTWSNSTSLCSDAYMILLHRTLSDPHASLSNCIEHSYLKMHQSDFHTVFCKYIIHSSLPFTFYARYFGIAFLQNHIWPRISKNLLNGLLADQLKELKELCTVLGPFFTIRKVIPFLLLILKKDNKSENGALSEFFTEMSLNLGVGFTRGILIPMLLGECQLITSENVYYRLQTILKCVCTSLDYDFPMLGQILEDIQSWSLAQNHSKPVLLWLDIIQALQKRLPGSMNNQTEINILGKQLTDYLLLSLKSSNRLYASFDKEPILLAYTMLCQWFGQQYIKFSFPWIAEIERKLHSAIGILPTISISPTVLNMPFSFTIEDKMTGELLSSPQKRSLFRFEERENWRFLLSSFWSSKTDTFKNQKLMSFSSHPGVKTISASSNFRLLLSGGRDRKVRLWSLDFHKFLEEPASNNLLLTYSEHSDVVREINFLGPYVVSGDGSIRLWDVETTQTLRHICSKSPLRYVQTWPDSRLIVGITRNKTIFIDDIRSKVGPTYLSTGISSTTPISATAIDSRSGLIAVGSISGTVNVLDLRTGSLLSVWKAHETEIRHLTFTDEALVSAALGSPDISFWDPSSSRTIKSTKLTRLNEISFLKNDAVGNLLAMDPAGHLAFVSLSTSQIDTMIKLRSRDLKFGSWSCFENYWDGPKRFLFTAVQSGHIHCYH